MGKLILRVLVVGRGTKDGEVVWAGQGFGGQYLLVLPSHDTVAVINSWNLFGGRAANLRDALVAVLAPKQP